MGINNEVYSKKKIGNYSHLSSSSVPTFDATIVWTLFLKLFLERNSLSSKGIINERSFIATALLANFVSFSVYHVTRNCTIHVHEYQSTVNKVTCGRVIWLPEITMSRSVDIEWNVFRLFSFFAVTIYFTSYRPGNRFNEMLIKISKAW